MTKTIHFNTKRMYSKLGQRISATLHDHGVVTFWDHDRMIDGQFTVLDDVFFNQGSVMSEYDGGRYKNTQQSWLDAMMPEGHNHTYLGR